MFHHFLFKFKTTSRFTARRNAGGWLKKNIRIEEYAGLREAKYKAFKMDDDKLVNLLLYLFIPAGFVYIGVTEELVCF